MSTDEHTTGQRILVADDDEFIRDLVSTALRFVGFEVELASDGTDACAKAATFLPELIVLDVMMPGIDGYEVCRRLRADGVNTPIVFLTAKDAVEDRLVGFTRGGDDYVTKPFSLEELVARIRAVLKRVGGSGAPSTRHRYADLVLDEDAHRVWRAGALVDLSPTEFQLIRYLLINAERVISKAQILDHVWHYDFDGDARIIENYISYLRKKIDTIEPKLIHTVRGVGYTLRADTR